MESWAAVVGFWARKTASSSQRRHGDTEDCVLGKMKKVIYMPLVGRGPDCWRPVRAVQVDDDIFEVADGIPEDESWAFAPSARVRCRETVFADGRRGLAAFAYAIETNPHYRILKDHIGQALRIVLADGEEAVVKLIHVDEEHEDFVYDLLSTNRNSKYQGMPTKATYAAKFADLVFAHLENLQDMFSAPS